MPKVDNLCKYCDVEVPKERIELGYQWCTAPYCSSLGIKSTNRIVLVNGHKGGYQPMFIDEVKKFAYNPKRG